MASSKEWPAESEIEKMAKETLYYKGRPTSDKRLLENIAEFMEKISGDAEFIIRLHHISERLSKKRKP